MSKKKFEYHPDLKYNAGIHVNYDSFVGQTLVKLVNALNKRNCSKYLPPEPVVKKEFSITCRDGVPINCYMFEPKDSTSDEVLPAVINLHGGGWMVRSMLYNQQLATEILLRLRCRVFIPEYRLAPRYFYPTPMVDCCDAILCIADQAEELKIDRDRIILTGESAGGTLVASCHQLLRDAHHMKFTGLCMVYPATDLNSQDYPSMETYRDGALSYEDVRFSIKYYIQNPDCEWNQYISPMAFDFGDTTDFPPTYIETGSMDCLCDEVVAYHDKMTAAGINTELCVVPGAYHGYDADIKNRYVQKFLDRRIGSFEKMLNGTFGKG